MVAKSKPKRKAAQPRNRAGLLPDQYRKRSTVYVERVRRSDEAHRYTADEMMATDVYYVETMRTDGNWQHRIDILGETFVIPGKVFERIAAGNLGRGARKDAVSKTVAGAEDLSGIGPEPAFAPQSRRESSEITASPRLGDTADTVTSEAEFLERVFNGGLKQNPEREADCYLCALRDAREIDGIYVVGNIRDPNTKEFITHAWTEGWKGDTAGKVFDPNWETWFTEEAYKDIYHAEVIGRTTPLEATKHWMRTGELGPSAVERSSVREEGFVPASIREQITSKPAFKKWFGNSAVVDGNGEPLGKGTVHSRGCHLADGGQCDGRIRL